MSDKVVYSWRDFENLCAGLAIRIQNSGRQFTHVYGIPNGGSHVATAIAGQLWLRMCDFPPANPDLTVVVDDLVDSGATMQPFIEQGFHCDSLLRKDCSPQGLCPDALNVGDAWAVFPWETQVGGPTDAVTRLIQYIGEDVKREGLHETPARVVRAYDELFAGYRKNPADVFKDFDADGCDQMVLLKDIEMISCCEHHMLPFIGKAHIAYIPDKRVIGVSKLARLLDIFAQRLQIQERIGEQITDALMTHLQPRGAACVIEAQHLCMKGRGVKKQHSIMITSSLKGIFLTKPEVRAEFMGLIR